MGYKRLNLVFHSIFFIFIFQNLSGAEHSNLNCKEMKKDNITIESTTEKIPNSVPMQESDESYTVDKKMVLFFTLTQDEYDSLCENDQWQLSDALDDFYAYSHSLTKFLDEHNISHDWIKKRKIVFFYENGKKEELKFDKEESFAWILFDRVKKPKIFYGVYTSIDMITEVEKYFEIKQK